VGYNSLYDNTTGYNNTSLGYAALTNNTTGYNNTAIGREALENATTAAANTAVGVGSGSQITTGQNNTILGRYSGNQGGLDIRTSSNYIVLSDGDGNPRGIFDGSGNFLVGVTENPAGSDTGIGLLSNGNFNQTKGSNMMNLYRGGVGSVVTFRQGTIGGSFSSVGTISVTGSATAYNTSSDYRLKENVTADWDATTRLKQLKPVRFNFISDADTTVDGFLAHEVQSVVPEAITGTHNEVDADGNPVYQGIDQSKLVPLLVKTIQELEARIAALESN
jgi:hypothetical protein